MRSLAFTVFALLVACSSDETTPSSGSTSSSTGSSAATGGAGGAGGTGGAAGGSGGAATGGGGASALCALGDAWELVEDFVPSSTEGASSSDVAWNEAGEMLVVGGTFGPDPTADSWLVRRSKDGGKTWELVDDFQMVAMHSASAAGIARAPSGDLFVSGSASDATDHAHRLIRLSTDGGDTWKTVDDFVLESGFDAYGGAVAIDVAGYTYVGGQAGSAGGTHQLIRRSTDAGMTWTTALDFQLAPGKVTVPRGLTVDPTRAVWVTTYAVDAGGASHWIVRRGDTNAVWTTVDDFSLAPATPAMNPGGVSVGSRIWVAGGAAAMGGGSNRWIVRSAEMPGDTWSTVADLPIDGEGASSVYEDGAGALTVAGTHTVTGDPKPYRAVTRRSTDGGKTFQVLDEFAYEAGVFMSGGTPDKEGNLYATGIGLGADGRKHWLLRLMKCK